MLSKGGNDEILSAWGEGDDPNPSVFEALVPGYQTLREETVHSDTDRAWGQIDNRADRINGQRPFVAIIDETSSTSEMIDSLLILARADAGRYQAPATAIDGHQVVADVCQRYMSDAERKHLDLLYPLAISDSYLHMAEAHFRQVITILLDNAIKYTPTGGKVSVAYDVTDSFTLRVSDTGCGIEPEHLPRVFDRFYRADSVRTDVKEGIGLGLPIAKAIVDLYQGTIEIRSEIGLGTCVTVVLPSSLVAPRF